jgi:hypothetical protein
MMRSILGALNVPCSNTGVSASSNAPRGDCIAVARVHAEQTALVVVEVEKVEADTTISDRGNLELAAAMGQALQRRLEDGAAHSVEHDLGAAAVRGTTNDGLERLIAGHQEIVDRARRRRIIGELSSIHADDASSAPFPDLRRSTTDPAASTSHQQRLSRSELRVLDKAEPGGEIGDADRGGLLQG